ncbi:hypothetical protein ELG83_02505 [Rhizobium leguminosarum]|uniref:Uncharacterized protein n=2 Tax=Rhizobium/Agrobacterium group TaxID=227290 RepID=Q1ML17_RHIJ3|nr:hypothetical protein [Rhizobium leguminosarum]NKL24167.1 hypothetical protein [Rhizobium leguminosarum bv. viciae]CAK06337.1 conserved hypothetical protein [Rhizobium johnstonii 3841]NEJ80608.1 hypothetical protein [Rhizobium leguminosarum]TBF38357.1 hypothetical protein ELG88_02515 [Rhizobium leguminosarum]
MTLAYYAKNAATAERVRARMARLGVTPAGHKVWTEIEDDFCRLLYFDHFALRQILRHRTARAIQARCCELGFGRKYHRWGPLERQKLRKLYPEASREEICATFPDIPWENIQAAARYYGYRRKKKRYVITGIAANDQVRAFCYDLGWIMRDLDEESGTGRYFQRNGSRRKYPDFKAISKAVKALGGILEVRWQEE